MKTSNKAAAIAALKLSTTETLTELKAEMVRASTNRDGRVYKRASTAYTNAVKNAKVAYNTLLNS